MGKVKQQAQDDAKIVDEIEKTIQKLLNLNIIESLSDNDSDLDKKPLSSTASNENHSSGKQNSVSTLFQLNMQFSDVHITLYDNDDYILFICVQAQASKTLKNGGDLLSSGEMEDSSTNENHEE